MKKTLLCLFLLLGFISISFAENFNLISNDTITKKVIGSLKFYDESGPNSDYIRGHSGAVTFVPSTKGKVVKLVINQATDLAYADKMTIYNGNSFEGETLISKKGDFRDVPLSILSTAQDGSLTFDFYSKPSTSSYSYEGWDIDIVEYTPLPLNYENTDVSSQAPTTVFRNTHNVVLERLAVEINGDFSQMEITSIDLSFTGNLSMIDNTNIYYTGTSELFTTHTEKFSAPSSTKAFNINKTINKPGLYYFWVTVDISSKATTNDIIHLKANSITIDKEVHLLQNTSCNTTLTDGFHGTYTIGHSSLADYSNFNDALVAMRDGIDGPVVFNIENGTYPRIELPNIPGSSSVNTIIFKGDKKSVFFENTGMTASDKKGLIDINGMDFLTLDGFSALNVSNDWQAAILIHNVSQNVSIKNAHITAPTFNDYSHNMDGVITADGENIAYHNNDFLTISNCKIEGGKYAVRIDGTGYVALPKQEGVCITNNTISNFGYGGIYITKDRNYQITNNTIQNNAALAGNSKCIDAVAMPGAIISNNRLLSNTSYESSAIYLRRRDDNESNEATRIYNNSIYIKQAIGNSYGINFTDPMRDLQIIYNTISMNGNSNSSACLFSEGNSTSQHIIIQNNILQNNANGYAIRIKSENALTAELNFNHNVYYGTMGLSNWDYSNWKTQSNDIGSQLLHINFIAQDILEIQDNTDIISGIPVDYISSDINNITRGLKPTPGAFEYQQTTNVAPNILVGYPILNNITDSTAIMLLKADDNGTAYYYAALSNETTPTADFIKTNGHNIPLTKNLEKKATIKSLKANSQYKVYIILISLQNVESNIIISNTFTTDILPTSVADFENTTSQNSILNSGTLEFRNCVLEESSGLNNSHCALIKDGTSATITNSTTGIELSGFYLNSNATVSIDVINGDNQVAHKIIEATNRWEYISLKELGLATKIVFTTTSTTSKIDNFCGQPQKLNLEMNNVAGNANETLNLDFTREGGVYPFSYEWQNSEHTTISNTQQCSIANNASTQISLTITDAWGEKISKKIDLLIKGERVIGDFEDLYLKQDTAWAGDWDDKEHHYKSLFNHFFTGSYQLSNYCIPGLKTWAFFAYGNETSSDFTYSNYVEDQFRNSAGGGYDGSTNYGISYCYKSMGHTDLTVSNNSEGDSIPGLYITNTAYLYDCALNGDNISEEKDGTIGKPFATGDSIVLIAHGYLNNNEISKTTFYLADYRNSNENEHYILNHWKYMDLSNLGKIQFVRFTMSSSKSNTQGMSTPAYFALDNIGAKLPTTRITTNSNTTNSKINLNVLCPLSGTGITHYTLLKKQSHTLASITNNQLDVNVPTEGTYTFVIKGDNAGYSNYYEITLLVNKDTGIETINTNHSIIYNGNELIVESNIPNYNISIYNTLGICIHNSLNNNNTCVIILNSLPKGIYIVKLNKAQEIYTKKISI